MRVLIIVHGADCASARYRALQFVPFLEQAGAKVRVERLPAGARRRLALFREAKRHETTFLQKRLLPEWQTLVLRNCARRLVFDFDDAVCFRDTLHGASRSFTRRRRFSAIVRNADLVIAGNDYLAGLAWPLARKVVVIPTALDPAKYRSEAGAGGGGVAFGWIGGRSTLPYLEAIRPALEEAGRSVPGIRLKIVCDAFLDLANMPVEKKPWSEEGEAGDVAGMDVGLAPSVEDRWTMGKCGLKILQYFAASRPVVASPVGVQREMVRHGETGFLATTPEGWTDALVRLASSPDMRKGMGDAGRKALEARYSLARVAPSFVQAVAQRG